MSRHWHTVSLFQRPEEFDLSDAAARRSLAIPRSGSAALLAVGSVVLVTLSVLPLIPPAPVALNADAAEFSAERSFRHVERVAERPHRMGRAAIVEVRGYLVDELATLGLGADLQIVVAPDYFGEPDRTVEVVNIVSRISGTNSAGAVVLMAHYDTVPTTPGANDNSAAVATVLEAARALIAGPALRNDIVLLFTDGEEPAPRFGSSAFVAEHPWFADVELVLNYEAIGGSGPSMLIEMNGPDRSMIDQYAASVPNPTAFSFTTELVGLIGGSNTDFALFRDAGIAGFDFAYLLGSPIYHTSDDNVEKVSLRSLQHHGSNALSLARRFGGIDLGQPTDDGETVFFTIFGAWVIRYPAAWVLPLAFVIVLGFGVVVGRRRSSSIRQLLWGAWIAFLSIIGGTVVSSTIWWILVGLRRTPVMWESYFYLAVLLALGALTCLALMNRAEQRSIHVDVAGGAVLVWIGLAVLTGISLPGASYLFTWPALAGVAALGMTGDDGGRSGVRCGLIVAVPTFILMIPAMDLFFQLAQPRPGNLDSEVVFLISITLFLGLLVVALLRPTRVIAGGHV